MRLPDVQLTDGTVVLRAWREEDAPVRVVAGKDPDIRTWTTVPRDADLDAARQWVAEAHAGQAAGRCLFRAVESEGVCVGSVGLIEVIEEHRRAEVGYWLLPGARGRGLASRALALLADWALAELPLNRLDLYTNTDNERSMAVATGCGFAREGLLRAWHVTPWGVAEDLVLFGRLRGTKS